MRQVALGPGSVAAAAGGEVRLGLRANLAQFTLLVVVNAFVGAMVGLERSILPAIAEQDFHLAARAAVLSFIVVFGVTKALTNYLAGRFSDAVGRKTVLVAGWLVATPVPFLLMWAPSWSWILFANVLLGVSQGLTWSTTVIMKIDLAGPARRGLAMGLNEFAGYMAVALSALATGHVAAVYGLRPQPFYLGIGFVLAGLALSVLAVRETHGHARHEARSHATEAPTSQRTVFLRTSFTDPDLSSVSQAGLVNNLNDGMAWGLFPLFFAAAGMSLERIAWLAAIYPAVWGAGQLATGALSDRIGRKWLIAGGMWVQAAGIATIVLSSRFTGFGLGAVLLGVGTAMVYPTLLAAIGDVAHPTWRASSVGVYRLWRDLGYAVGAVLAGVTADALGVPVAIWLVAAVTFASGLVVATRMRETRRPPGGRRLPREAAALETRPVRSGWREAELARSSGTGDLVHAAAMQQKQARRKRMAKMIVKKFSSPDETRPFQGHGHVDLIKIGEGTIGRGVFEPGWKWSVDVKPLAGTKSCQASHSGYVLSGRMRIVMDDGQQIEVGPGDYAVIPPGHDAWTVGNEACVMLDVAGMENYARPSREAGTGAGAPGTH